MVAFTYCFCRSFIVLCIVLVKVILGTLPSISAIMPTKYCGPLLAHFIYCHWLKSNLSIVITFLLVNFNFIININSWWSDDAIKSKLCCKLKTATLHNKIYQSLYYRYSPSQKALQCPLVIMQNMGSIKNTLYLCCELCMGNNKWNFKYLSSDTIVL